MIFHFLLLVTKMGMLAAQFNTTDQAVTISKNFTESENITETVCSGRCNITCFLTSQSLQEFPSCIPSTVQVLNLDFNNLTIIGDQDLGGLFDLHMLALAHNQIEKIQWESNVLPQLMSLDLSYNQLSVVPKCIMLKNVKWLSLEGNPIVYLPSLAFTCFPNLAFLNLSSTLIGTIASADIDESAFALNATETQKDSLTSLHSLDLSATYLHGIKEAWSKDLPNLKVLHITKMINMKSLDDELLKWFSKLEFLNCAGSRALSHVRTEMFKNATELIYLSFHNCNLTSFPPWNVTSGFVTIDLSENPLDCECEYGWLLSDPVHINLLRANETYCNSYNGDMPRISLVEYQHFCKIQINPSEVALQDFSTSTPTNNITDNISGTQKDFLTATSSPQNMGQNPYLPESVTVFKTTAPDSAILSPKAQTSPVIQGTITPETENGISKESTTSMNSFGGPSTDIIYPTASTLITNVFTSPEGSSKAGSGQPIPEDTSNEEQAYVPQDFSEDYDEENQQERSTIPSTISACDYDGCRHLQKPCIELQQHTPCLCPGLSGEDMIPDSPYLKNITQITDTSAQIHWCSPNSVLEKYHLVYQAGSQIRTIDNIPITMRQFTLYNLSPYTTYKVCMVGVNRKGQSETENMASRTACSEFNTRPSYVMIFAILSGLGGLFLVIITVLAAFLYKTCKSNMVNQYDTHLVSYKNPAFEYHLTIPSYH
ncbi:leucine-rich repeat neuronal protein 4 [Pyxicephalus adspersus]|uniref:Fibronectin type-III domain-containing protein n=1 Tax=Pyxicephalus adspersus TaxID=30357 RepID=A0AAV3A7I3_PYXAD|nr:TPA: hypothetical protein GDO54_011297 [Pyxicephalus adspersus]